MKRVLIPVVVVLGLAGVIAASLLKSREQRGVEVYAEQVARRAITRTVKASGRIDARVSVDISAHVVAKIEKLYVEEGDHVTAGQPFLELEKDVFTAAVDSWRAQLRQADVRVRQAEVDLADAETRLRRQRRLAEEGIASEEELESAELRKRSAELQLEQSHDQVEYAQANLTKALDDYGKTTIYAPVAGRVVQLDAEEGEVVVSGVMNNPATKIATVADLSELLAEIDVDENEIVAVELGQPVTVKVDAVPDESFTGKVVEVGSSGFNRAGQGDVTFFAVEVLLDHPDETLRPGMSVRAEIEVATHDDALVIPIQAVVERSPKAEEETEGEGDAEGGDGDAVAEVQTGAQDEPEMEQVVYVIEDGTAVRHRVETGLSTVTEVEIVSGVDEGAQVITGPFRTLRDLADGDAVEVTDETSKEDE